MKQKGSKKDLTYKDLENHIPILEELEREVSSESLVKALHRMSGEFLKGKNRQMSYFRDIFGEK
jgi:hypothetical protein